MRVDYNVLWVDDQPKNLDSYAKAIDRGLRRNGFRLCCEFAKTVDQANEFLSDSVYGDHIDLVLMDFDLGDPTNGVDGLKVVRKQFPFKDVIFYSAQTGGLKQKVADKQIEGVYCSDREYLTQAVIGVFEAHVQKVVDIDHSRGIVMGSSSDIDGMVLDCLKNLCQDNNGRIPADAMNHITERIQEIKKRVENDFKNLESVSTIDDLEPLHMIYTSVDRLKLLKKTLAKIEEYKSYSKGIGQYVGKIAPERNKLAHIRVTKEGFSRKIIDQKGNEFTNEDARELRISLLNHQESMEKLLKLLDD